MHRVGRISGQLVASPVAAGSGRITPETDLPIPRKAPDEQHKPLSEEDIQERRMELFKAMMGYRQSIDELAEKGTLPSMTLFDVILATRNEGAVASDQEIGTYIDNADKVQLNALESLPGPWRATSTREEKIELIQKLQLASAQGHDIHLFAQWQQEHGDRGLSTNIVVPQIAPIKFGVSTERRLVGRVLVADPEDCERISRIHVRKEGNFEPVLMDSVISTTNNDYWMEQRSHLSEVFLPLSSLAKIFPVSLNRARACAQRLGELSKGGTEVDMSDFFLHEAQAQLQLALLGMPESIMEKTNATIRAVFASDSSAKPGELAGCMREIIEAARADKSLGLPSDINSVRGPLSRAVETSDLTPTADYGNMLLILFAGHDTTGHTMTWMLFELCRNPSIQLELQVEVDEFFRSLDGCDPTYRDLSKLELMDLCITETLRLWPAVPNGTFRQLHFDDTLKGSGGEDVLMPRGSAVNVGNWSRHRNKDLWGEDADKFNPKRHWKPGEVAHVGCSMAGKNIESDRFSPFSHNPRSCLGKNFAQMEMRLIMLYLLRDFSFGLAPAYQRLMNRTCVADPKPDEFRGINRGTMGPMDLEQSDQRSWGTRPLYAMKMIPRARTAREML